ncbi:MAG: hypothetical protein AAF754_19775, partial [Pseudomonadota bacterium]
LARGFVSSQVRLNRFFTAGRLLRFATKRARQFRAGLEIRTITVMSIAPINMIGLARKFQNRPQYGQCRQRNRIASDLERES